MAVGPHRRTRRRLGVAEDAILFIRDFTDLRVMALRLPVIVIVRACKQVKSLRRESGGQAVRKRQNSRYRRGCSHHRCAEAEDGRGTSSPGEERTLYEYPGEAPPPHLPRELTPR